MKKKTALVLMLFLPACLFAQESWDLKTCIEYGLKNNRNSVIYENEKLAADAAAKEALAEYLPKIGLNATLDDNLKVQTSIIPAGVFGPTDIKVAFSQKYNTNASAQLDQVIYDQSLLNGFKANKYNKVQAELNIQKSKETIIYNIVNAFYQIHVYRKQLELLSGNINTYQKQIDVFRLQVQKGVALQKDLEKVTVDYNNANSQVRVAESNLTMARNQLKYEMGFPFQETLQTDSISDAEMPENVPLVTASEDFSLSGRTEYKLSEVNTKLLAIELSRIKSGWLPKLSGYVRYGANGFGSELGPAVRDLNEYAAIGLKLNFPIFEFFKRNAQYKQASYKSLNALEQLSLDARTYELEFENAKTKLAKAQSTLESDQRNIELAQSVFKVTDLQYRKGVESLTEWLNAQTSINTAQNNYLNSLYSLLQARLDLKKASGQLKTFYTTR